MNLNPQRKCGITIKALTSTAGQPKRPPQARLSSGCHTMEPLQQQEWYELRSQTWQLRRRREHILRSKHRPLLQYLVMPSLTDTWCIDVVRTGEGLAAYHTVWRMTQGINVFATAIERLKHPRPYTPTVASTELDVGSDAVASMLARLGQIEIPFSKLRIPFALMACRSNCRLATGGRGSCYNGTTNCPTGGHLSCES